MEVTVGLRPASVLPNDRFDGLLDPATRSQLAALRGYGVLGVAGQTTSLLGLDSSRFLLELCLTTANAADAAPPSRKRPLLIGAAIAQTASGQSKVPELTLKQGSLLSLSSIDVEVRRKAAWRVICTMVTVCASRARNARQMLNSAKDSAHIRAAEFHFDFTHCCPRVLVIACDLSSRVLHNKRSWQKSSGPVAATVASSRWVATFSLCWPVGSQRKCLVDGNEL